MGQSAYSFSKEERLTGKKKIEGLFKKGSSFYLGPFQVRYSIDEEAPNHQVLISVPKRKFKRAVDRNLIKRRIREAYRLNKPILYNDDREEFYSIAFIYLSSKILTFHDIQDQLIGCLKRLDKNEQKRSKNE